MVVTDIEHLTNYESEHIYHGEITRIIDGDTPVVRLDIPFRISLEVHIRIKDIDTCEISRPKCDKAREMGYTAKQLLVDRFLGKRCTVRTFNRSFIRWVGDVIVHTEGAAIDIRSAIITAGLQKSDLSCAECSLLDTCSYPKKGEYPDGSSVKESL